jgi:hypothetical protein
MGWVLPGFGSAQNPPRPKHSQSDLSQGLLGVKHSEMLRARCGVLPPRYTPHREPPGVPPDPWRNAPLLRSSSSSTLHGDSMRVRRTRTSSGECVAGVVGWVVRRPPSSCTVCDTGSSAVSLGCCRGESVPSLATAACAGCARADAAEEHASTPAQSASRAVAGGSSQQAARAVGMQVWPARFLAGHTWVRQV